MPVREMESATWEDVGALIGSAEAGRAVAILPIGATEAHGPHLPLATDVVIAQAMAREGAARLTARGYAVLVLPPLAYTAAPFAAGFPGTISLRPETVTAVVVDIARSLVAQGVGVLAIANAHLDPAHLGSLRAATKALSEEEKVKGAGKAEAGAPSVAFPDLTRRRFARRLTEEFQTGATHGGRFEGSIVMAERLEWVRESIQAALPPVPHSLSDAIRAGKRTFEDAGGPRAYFGWPADASAEEGRRSIAVLGEILEEAVLEAEGVGSRGGDEADDAHDASNEGERG
jgi:creatinine amidohydrolase